MKKSLFIISFSILFLSSLIANGQIKRTNSQDDYNRWFNRQKASGNEQEAREADTQKNNPFLNNLRRSTEMALREERAKQLEFKINDPRFREPRQQFATVYPGKVPEGIRRVPATFHFTIEQAETFLQERELRKLKREMDIERARDELRLRNQNTSKFDCSIAAPGRNYGECMYCNMGDEVYCSQLHNGKKVYGPPRAVRGGIWGRWR